MKSYRTLNVPSTIAFISLVLSSQNILADYQYELTGTLVQAEKDSGNQRFDRTLLDATGTYYLAPVSTQQARAASSGNGSQTLKPLSTLSFFNKASWVSAGLEYDDDDSAPDADTSLHFEGQYQLPNQPIFAKTEMYLADKETLMVGGGYYLADNMTVEGSYTSNTSQSNSIEIEFTQINGISDGRFVELYTALEWEEDRDDDTLFISGSGALYLNQQFSFGTLLSLATGEKDGFGLAAFTEYFFTDTFALKASLHHQDLDDPYGENRFFTITALGRF
ncbi:MAG: hypothetical protein MI864_26300 [Pseudomonadales bacterium]|nr:hypothetical protein [Pseudomonadales bacterium]